MKIRIERKSVTSSSYGLPYFQIMSGQGYYPPEERKPEKDGNFLLSGIISGNDAERIKRAVNGFDDNIAVMQECLAWVIHWKDDVKGGLKPTPESLEGMRVKLVDAIAKARGQ